MTCMAKSKLEDLPPVYKCFKCMESFDSLPAWLKHREAVEHEYDNNSICERCGQIRIKVISTGKVPRGDKGPKVYCKNCVKAITAESKVGKETEEIPNE